MGTRPNVPKTTPSPSLWGCFHVQIQGGDTSHPAQEGGGGQNYATFRQSGASAPGGSKQLWGASTAGDMGY